MGKTDEAVSESSNKEWFKLKHTLRPDANHSLPCFLNFFFFFN